MFTLAITYQNTARQVTALAVLVCFISVVCYGVFLLVAVEKAAAQQKYESSARDIGASLATLESQYLAQSNALTQARAKDFGLVHVPTSQIAYQEISAPRFSLR